MVRWKIQSFQYIQLYIQYVTKQDGTKCALREVVEAGNTTQFYRINHKFSLDRSTV